MAVRAPPTCRNPVGEGANRSFIGAKCSRSFRDHADTAIPRAARTIEPGPMRRGSRGFSLIELLAGLVILTFVITTSLAMFVNRTRTLRQASEILLAYQVLGNEAELWRRVDYKYVQSSAAFTTATDLLAPMQPYTTKVDVKTQQTGIKTVTLTISWQNGKREAKLALTRVDTGGGNLW